VDSDVRVIDSIVETGTAGAGGDGQPGQLGQPGGEGGPASATGCQGGDGGAGSDGGPGGGGAGGLSAGVAFRGTRPLIESDVALWTIAAAGVGGAHGDGLSSAPSGTSKALLEL
jgi:hypothetical protein